MNCMLGVLRKLNVKFRDGGGGEGHNGVSWKSSSERNGNIKLLQEMFEILHGRHIFEKNMSRRKGREKLRKARKSEREYERECESGWRSEKQRKEKKAAQNRKKIERNKEN